MVYFPGRGCWFLKMPSQSAGTELSGFEDSDTFYLVLMETNLPTPIWQGPTVNLPEGFNFFSAHQGHVLQDVQGLHRASTTLSMT